MLAHELVEAILCLKRKIDPKAVDLFDMRFESQRAPGDTGEPGDDPQAPYFREHQFATKIERMLAEEMGVDWETYERTVMSL